MSPGRKQILGVSRMERIQESRLTILERWHSPYERRSKLTIGSMESPVQHIGRHRRFSYQSHRKRTSRVAIPYQKRRFRDVHIRKYFITADEWTYRPTKRGVALHFGEWKELKHIIPCWKKKSQNWDSWFHCIEQQTCKIKVRNVLFVCYKYVPIYPNSVSRIQTVKEERRVLRDVFSMPRM